MCRKEINLLRRYDKEANLILVDIQQADFSNRHPEIDYHQAIKRLHGRLNGETIYGLDVTYWAWRLVGKGKWVAVLRWPLLRHVFNWFYKVFAKHRLTIAGLLYPGSKCTSTSSINQGKSTNHD